MTADDYIESVTPLGVRLAQANKDIQIEVNGNLLKFTQKFIRIRQIKRGERITMAAGKFNPENPGEVLFEYEHHEDSPRTFTRTVVLMDGDRIVRGYCE